MFICGRAFTFAKLERIKLSSTQIGRERKLIIFFSEMGGSGYELWKVVEQGRLDNDECFIALIVDFLQYSL